MLKAAHRLFLDRGYAATTVAAVAGEAGVSVETVCKSVGKKPELAKAVFDVAVVGDDEDVPMIERETVARNMAEPDPVRKLEAYGDHLAARPPGSARSCSSSGPQRPQTSARRRSGSSSRPSGSRA